MATTMTRENKLSIVIAFGLLIFVGMLVADHYSIATHREVANLGSNVPPPPLLSAGVLVEGVPTHEVEPIITNPAGDKIHIVKKGETMRSICSDEYGDSGLANAIAQWNSIADPDDIGPGQQLAMPTRTTLMAGSFILSSPNQIATPNPASVENASMGTYKVKKGDTLSEIAQQLLGTTKRTHVLIKYNRDVMPNPDRIRPGMVLRYPTNTQ